jgi:predicted MFS family arabinose efflux permease
MSIGLTFIGPLFGAFLLRTMSYQLLFKLLALMTLVPIALVFFFHNEPVQHGSATEFKQAVLKQLGEFRQLIRRRELYLPLFTESISTSFFATFSAFIVVLVVQSLHLPVTTASLLLTIEGGLFIVTVFAAGPLLKLFSQAQLYWVSVSVVIAGLIYLALAGSFGSLAGSAVVLGLGLGLINLVTSARIGQLKGEKGKIMGLFSAAIGVGISIGPMAGGAIGSWLGTRAIFLAFIPLFLALAIAASWVEGRGQLTPDGDTPVNSELSVDTDELATSN